MLILDISSNEKGQLFTQKSPLSNGLFLNVKHSLCNKLAITTKQISFTHLSFNRTGDRFIACDLHGNIYLFDLSYNRFMRLNRIGTTCTVLAFNLKCKTEYLVATVDGTIKCFNTETRDLVGWMKGHERAIVSLSVHPSTGDLVISMSSDVAQLWDLNTFECKHKLNINSKKNVEIIKICFAPTTNDIVAVFKDDTIAVWSSDNIALKFQHNGVEEATGENAPTDDTPKHFYKYLSISSDGKLLATGSRYNYVHVWDVDAKQQIGQIELADKLSTIKDLAFVLGAAYDSRLLLVLTQEGSLDVYSAESYQFLLSLNSNGIVHNLAQILNEQKLTHIICPPKGHFMCGITHNGYIQVFDLDASPIRSHKTTSGLMKSSVNTNNSKTILNETEKRNQKATTAEKIKARQSAKKTPNVDILSEKLAKILKYYHEYPSRYRMFIWKTVLRLPENYEAYASFVDRGTHPAFLNLTKKYPLKSQKCIRLLERTLSALAHWSPIFADCDYLPLMIFPFVKLFENNQVTCFEIVATLICNWCQHWFEFFPNPPMNILNMIENLLAYHDRNLLDHYVRNRITCQIYGWSLLETVFSEVFNKNEWQILFDNIFSNHPGFLLYLAVAYSICNRTALLKVTELADARFFFRHRNPLSVQHLIKEAVQMMETTPSDLDPCKLLHPFEPLTRGTYPVFNKRPSFISDFQMIEKNKILQQELNYLRERDAHIEYHKFNEGRKLENEYELKKLLWDTNHNKQYKESVEEYERKQRYLEQLSAQNQPKLQNNANLAIKVVTHDRNASEMANKMRQIDENFDEIQHQLKSQQCQNLPNSTSLMDDADPDDVFREIEIEIKKNRQDALRPAEEVDERKQQQNDLMSCLGSSQTRKDLDATDSTVLSLDRGRAHIETQEREVMKRVYELRKNIALENRKKT